MNQAEVNELRFEFLPDRNEYSLVTDRGMIIGTVKSELPLLEWTATKSDILADELREAEERIEELECQVQEAHDELQGLCDIGGAMESAIYNIETELSDLRDQIGEAEGIKGEVEDKLHY